MRSLSSQSLSTLYNHHLHIFSLSYSFLLMPGWWLSYSQRRSLPLWESQNISTHCQEYHTFYALGKAVAFGVTNLILWDTGTLPVKPGRIGSPNMYKEPSLSQCNLTWTCLCNERPTTNSLSNADSSPEWSSYMPITTQTEWKQRLVTKQC